MDSIMQAQEDHMGSAHHGPPVLQTACFWAVCSLAFLLVNREYFHMEK